MGKRVNPMDQIVQRSIGFKFRQKLFFNKYRDFKPDAFCRDAVDEQIIKLDGENSEFLEHETIE